jgi:hypothetical protein
MARKLSEIIAIIDAQKAAEASLAGVSISAGSIYTVIKYIVAYAHLSLELLMDMFTADLDQRAAQAIPGTAKWYADRVLEWQYGDALTVVDGKAVYAVIDLTKRIVTHVAITEVGGKVLIKVAKTSGGLLVKLTSAEMIALASYINDIKFAGTQTQIVSIDADIVKMTAVIYYDGEKLLTDVKALVEPALKIFLQTIYFDGTYNINKQRDALEAVQFVNDVDIQSVQIRPASGAYATVTRIYKPQSGYFKVNAIVDSAPGADDTLITYIPQ